jgi:hypothetical protein
VIGKRRGLYTDREEKGAEGLLVTFISPGEGVDAGETDAEIIEAVNDLLERGRPNRCNIRTANGAGLATDALLLGALAHLPGRARLIDATSLAGVEVGPRIGIVLGQAALVRRGCHQFPEREAATLGKEGGGRREGGGTLEFQAELLKGRVDLKVGHWP